MKTANPVSRKKLKIKRKDNVLEVGGGHNPHPRSNLVVDKHIDSNYHRSGDIFINKSQMFLQADGTDLPFKNNEFDYVISNQVLEHVDNPSAFLTELSRVAKRGFIETPSLIGEYLFPKESHKWVILELNNKLVIVDKKNIGLSSKVDFGELFLHYLPSHSIGYKILERTYPDIMTVRYEWDGEIEFVVNPTNPELLKYFERPWTAETIKTYFQKRNKASELFTTFKALLEIMKDYANTFTQKIFYQVLQSRG